MGKRALSMLVAMVLAMGVMPLPAWASGGVEGDDALQAVLSGLLEPLQAAFGGSQDADALPDGVSMEAERVGIGGGGALFDPAVSPFNADDMAVGTDMGDLYVTRDGGANWAKKTVGRVFDIQYDPTRQGTVYATGSGIWRSTDYGETFELMWPKAEHVTGEPTKYEQTRSYLFNSDGYDPYSQVVSVAIDRANNSNIYALATKSSDFILYQSTDGGDTFAEVARQACDMRGINDRYDNSKLVVNDGVCWLCTQAGIFSYGGTTTLSPVYQPDGETYFSVVDVAQVIDDGADGVSAGTCYWIAEGLESGKGRPVTSLRRFTARPGGELSFTDLTAAMNDQSQGLNRTISGDVDNLTDIHILGLAAPSATRLYFYTQVTTDANNTILARYDGSLEAPFKWIFGYQLNNSTPSKSDAPGRFDLQNISHADSYSVMYGIAASPAAPNRFLLSTGFGLYGSPDCEQTFDSKGNWYPRRSNVYQLYANLHASSSVPGYGGSDKHTYSSTGIDNVTTYGMRVDPFNKGHVAMLNTDFGLTLSNDAGITWSRSRSMNNGQSGDAQRKVPDTWSNTIYDLAFDRYVKGRMYSLWSGRHDAPYATTPASDKKAYGGFAAADVDEASWDALTAGWSKADGSKLSSKAGETALPANSIPVRLGVAYPADSTARAAGTDRTFWVACFGGGFYRSTDSGNTFQAVNSGIAETTDDMIYAADLEVSEDGNRIFGMTARRTDRSGTVGGKVYQWDWSAQAWAEIALPEGVVCPRDIAWDGRTQTLYISCVAGNTWIGGDGIQPDFKNAGGGLFTWHPGEAAASAVDAASAVVGDACSIEGAATDSAGNLFVSDVRGNVHLRRAGSDTFEKVYDRFHVAAKNVQLIDESASASGARADTLALPSLGGGQLLLTVRFSGDAGSDSGEVPAPAQVAKVKEAAEAALSYCAEQKFAAPALKDAFEMKLPESLCYSVGKGEYHVLHDGGYFSFSVSDENAVSADAVDAGDRLRIYDTLADAEAAANLEAPTAFITRGHSTVGDKGHGYYERVDALAAGEIGFTARRLSYALASAESAANPYQLGYTDNSGNPFSSVNAAIDAFHASAFHTLVFPQGDYRLVEDIDSQYDGRAYYGLDATLYTDGAVTKRARNSGHNSLWVIRGNVGWSAGESYVDSEGVAKKKDVYYHVSNIELNGLRLERRTGTSGYNRMVSVRSARNVTFSGCAFDGITADDAMPVSGDTLASPGAIVDFYGDYDNVKFLNSTIVGEAAIDIRDLCDHVDNIPASMQVASDYPTGGRNVVVRDNDITTYNFDEGLPIFAGNEQGLGSWSNGVFTEYPTLTHCLVEGVLVENNRYTMREPQTKKQRVVAITCGYQDSPVKNAAIRGNTFDVCANNYLILFGYAEDCQFVNNKVTLRRTTTESQIHELVHRSDHSRTGPTTSVAVSGNKIEVVGEDVTVGRMVSAAFGPEAVSFTGNDVTVEGTVSRVFDSTAVQTGNTFHLNYVKHLYDRVGEVANNTYDIKKLDTLYESYDTNAKADLNIHDERAAIGLYTSKYLLSFNGTPGYNGHSLTFADCEYDAGELSESYPRIAWSTETIADALKLNLIGNDISWLTSANNYAIQKNADGKVALAVFGSVYGSASVAALRTNVALAAGDVVRTKAYYEGGIAGDTTAGAGVYDIDKHADWQMSKDDGGRYIRLGNGLWAVLRFSGDNADTVDFYQYGARGDGETDDRAAVQAALRSGAATVHASAGTYLIGAGDAGGVSLPSDIALVGDGREACTFIAAEGYPNKALFAAYGSKDITLRGVGFSANIEKNPIGATYNDQGGISLLDLWGTQGTENVAIEDCRFFDNAYGAVRIMGGEGFTVRSCAFSNTDCCVITLGEVGVKHLTVTDNVMDGHRYSEAITLFTTAGEYDDVLIARNTIRNKTDAVGIFLRGKERNSTNVYENVRIEGNTVENCAVGLGLSNLSASCKVLNNTVANNATWRAAALLDCADALVDGLTVTNAQGYGLWLENCANVTVRGLDIEGFTLGNNTYAAVRLDGTGVGTTIAGEVAWTDASKSVVGVDARGSGYDLSGLTFANVDGKRALALAATASGNTFHTNADVAVTGTGDLTNDIAIDSPFEFSGGAAAMQSSTWQSRFRTSYVMNWTTTQDETLSSMPACQDGFARTLTVNAVNSAATLANGDGSQGSITWLGGGHTVAKGESATYKLVCQDGVWHEVEVAEGGPAAHELSSVAKLRMATALAVGDVAVTSAYYEDGPADGGATYDIVAAPVAAAAEGTVAFTDDGGSHIQLDNGLWAVLRVADGTVNVHQFGARGDGRTDGTAATANANAATATDDAERLTSVMDYAGANPGTTVFFPAGTYCVSRGIEVPAHTTLTGAYTTAAEEPAAAVVAAGKSATLGMYACGVMRAKPQDQGANTELLATITPLDPTSHATSLVSLGGSDDVAIDHLVIDAGRSIQAVVDALPSYSINNYDWTAPDMPYRGYFTALTFGGNKNVRVADCIVRNNVSMGCQFNGGENVSFERCDFLSVDVGIQEQGANPVKDVFIRDCYFEGHDWSEPVAFGPAYAGDATGIWIERNTMRGVKYGHAIAISERAQAYVDHTTFKDMHINGNTAYDMASFIGISVADGLEMRDNTGYDASQSYLYSCKNVTIDGLEMHGSARHGLLVGQECENVNITGLVVEDYGKDGGGAPGIDLSGTATNVSIAGTVKSTVEHGGPGVNLSGSGYDISGLQFDLEPANYFDVMVYEGAVGNTMRVGSEVAERLGIAEDAYRVPRVYVAEDAARANDFVFDYAWPARDRGTTARPESREQFSGMRATDDGAFETLTALPTGHGRYYKTIAIQAWDGAEDGTNNLMASYMETAQDGFTRTLSLLTASDMRLVNGDPSQAGAIVWAGERTLAASDKPYELTLVCRAGVWYEQGDGAGVNEFSSLTALREATGLTAGQVVSTRAYREGSDKGAASYLVCDAAVAADLAGHGSAALADDGGRLIELAGSPGLWATLVGVEVDAYAYGAYGDGEHDDTGVLQALLDSGLEGVRLSKGTYLVSAPLVATAPLSVEGVGADESRIVASSALQASSGATLLTVRGVEGLTVSGIGFAGWEHGAADGVLDLMRIDHCTRTRVSGCSFGPAAGDGIVITGSVRTEVNDCSISGVATGIHLSEAAAGADDAVSLMRNDISNVVVDGIAFTADGSAYQGKVAIYSNTVTGAPAGAGILLARSNRYDLVEIGTNVIDGCYVGIRTGGISGTLDATDNNPRRITSNTVRNATYGIIFEHSSGVALILNEVYDVQRTGLYLDTLTDCCTIWGWVTRYGLDDEGSADGLSDGCAIECVGAAENVTLGGWVNGNHRLDEYAATKGRTACRVDGSGWDLSGLTFFCTMQEEDGRPTVTFATGATGNTFRTHYDAIVLDASGEANAIETVPGSDVKLIVWSDRAEMRRTQAVVNPTDPRAGLSPDGGETGGGTGDGGGSGGESESGEDGGNGSSGSNDRPVDPDDPANPGDAGGDEDPADPDDPHVPADPDDPSGSDEPGDSTVPDESDGRTGNGDAADDSIRRRGFDGTAFGRGASLDALESALSSMKSDADPAGTCFAPLKARMGKVTERSEKLVWATVKGARKYAVYAAQCGKSHKLKRVAVVKCGSHTVRKIAGRKLAKGTYYKFMIVALDAKGCVLASSKIVHAATAGGKWANPAKVKAVKPRIGKLKLKKGEGRKLKVKAVKTKKGKLARHRKLMYESDNPKVATVTKAGKVEARGKGACWMYAYAQNGAYAKVKVTVR